VCICRMRYSHCQIKLNILVDITLIIEAFISGVWALQSIEYTVSVLYGIRYSTYL
jgi:hypothetical protein